MLKLKASQEPNSVILWIRGEQNSGKTTLAKEFCRKMKAVHLDGDDMRWSISADLGYSDKDRLENNLRIARLAVILEGQGFDVIVSTICPGTIKDEVYKVTGGKFIDL